MSNRISNLICPQSNCCPHTPHPQSPATQIYSFCSLYLRKWQFHLSSCSVKENSWSLFSFSINKYYKDLPSGFIQDLTTALPSFTDSTLEYEGQAYNPLPVPTWKPPTCSSRCVPLIEGSDRRWPCKSQDEDGKVTISLSLWGQSPCWPEIPSLPL